MELIKDHPIFAGILIFLAIAYSAIYFLGTSAHLKRRLFIPVNVLMGITVVVFVWITDGTTQTMLIFVPFLLISCYLNIRATKFCDSCGKTIINPNFLTPPKFCTNCGESLQ